MNNEQDNKLKRMKMHENNEGNAMLTRKGKKNAKTELNCSRGV